MAGQAVSIWARGTSSSLSDGGASLLTAFDLAFAGEPPPPLLLRRRAGLPPLDVTLERRGLLPGTLVEAPLAAVDSVDSGWSSSESGASAFTEVATALPVVVAWSAAISLFGDVYGEAAR